MDSFEPMQTTDSPSSPLSDSRVPRPILSERDQTHLIRFWNTLSTDEQTHLSDQIRLIDFDLLSGLVRETQTGPDDESAPDRPISSPPITDLTSRPADVMTAREVGETALQTGQVGVLIVAGGEGSRLGFEGPKGCFPLGPVSDASLYQWLLEKVVATSRRCGQSVPVYLMTSPSTHDETVRFLDEADWFGIPARSRHVFCQGTMPVVDQQGRILLESRSQLALSPDGHGGVVPALAGTGLLDSMRSAGIDHLFYCQVDNPVAPLLDPEIIGRHLLSDSQVTVLSVEKTDPTERAGTVVEVDGRLQVLEYSLIPESIARQREDSGQLKFRAANTGIHLFRTDFLDEVSRDADALPLHAAHKAVPHLDDQGCLIRPTEPNAVKFERFVFDIFPCATNTLVLQVDREECFLPLKDARSSETSPEAVRRKLSALQRNWLCRAGMDVPQEAAIEISPLVASSAEELAVQAAMQDWHWQPEDMAAICLGRAA